jgi:hypothetical protein
LVATSAHALQWKWEGGSYAKKEFITTGPKDMQARFEEITQLTDAFCHAYLNDEYQQLVNWLNVRTQILG